MGHSINRTMKGDGAAVSVTPLRTGRADNRCIIEKVVKSLAKSLLFIIVTIKNKNPVSHRLKTRQEQPGDQNEQSVSVFTISAPYHLTSSSLSFTF